VLGYRTSSFPGFYLRDSGHPVDWSVESAAEIADIVRARHALGTDRYGLVVANPIAPADELDHELHDELLSGGLAAAEAAGVRGKQVTPFLLEFFHRESAGQSLAANVALVLANARLAAEIAVELADGRA
jgi:pseudouridine-5'-phosphate glycosidase